MQIEGPAALPDDYYLANFHRLATFVAKTYRDILTPAERQWYASIQASSESAQRLYIRLLTRKGSVFRLSRLKYSEIPDLQGAAVELANQGLAATSLPDDLGVLLAAFTKPELIGLLDDTGSHTRTRVEILEALQSSVDPVRARHIASLQQADEWITLLGHQYWTIFRLGFFGNLHQDSSEFVLQELGTVKYENYRLDAAVRPFATREQLDAHLAYFECVALLDTINNKDARQLLTLVAQVPAAIEGDEHLQRRLDRFRNRVARQLERLDCIPQALELYAESQHPPARERRVRLHLKQGEPSEARRLLESMHERPYNDAELQVAERLQQQLIKSEGGRSRRKSQFVRKQAS